MAFEWLLKLYIIAFASFYSTDSFLQEPDPIVETDCGKLRGVQIDQNSFQFRGVPYAAPPIGPLRWRPPVSMGPSQSNCWNGIREATVFGAQCVQEGGDNIMGSEDCLFLNVWTPTLNSSARLPVLFNIHGGSLQAGNGNWEEISLAPSSELARDSNMVIVSINYRLQAFGFMALDWLRDGSPHNTSGNYGLMDMIEALRWVQRNVGVFGGDPTQVTIFGQSSGGTAVFALLASPLCHGLFRGAMMLSASPILNKTASEAFKDNEVFLRNTNCSDVTCLYNLTPEEVTASVPWEEYPFWHMNDQFALPTKGLFDGALAIVDGYVLKESPFDAWVHGRGVDVPVMIGSTAQEVNLITDPASAENWTWASGEYPQLVRTMLGPFSDVIAETALKLYSSRTGSPEYQYTTMVTDLRMTCGNDYLSLIAATSYSSNVYRYVTTYAPSTPLHLISDDQSARYAYHGIDIDAYFKDPSKITDPRLLQYNKLLRSEFTSFLNYGRPSSSDWLPYPKSTAVLSTVTNVTDAYHPVECEFWMQNGFVAYSWIN